jgi:hypothetical protein|uniref:Uncharacterized protein n=1 Tax=viral metagenome TaxID=1070528 RepID=A0A6C0BFV7_9ZZZZ
MSTRVQLPNPGLIYADVLWDTTRLPATMNNAGVVDKKDGVLARYDGVEFSGANPTNASTNPTTPNSIVNLVNQVVGTTVYNSGVGFDCLDPVNCVGGVRYVAMGGNANAAVGTQRQLADILEINSAGVITFFGQVDWRAGPNYNPGPISV